MSLNYFFFFSERFWHFITLKIDFESQIFSSLSIQKIKYFLWVCFFPYPTRNCFKDLKIVEWNLPSSPTSEYLFNKLSLGTRTLLKVSLALSTPFRPILWPISSTRTSGKIFKFSSLIGTRTPWIPSLTPLTINLAKT